MNGVGALVSSLELENSEVAIFFARMDTLLFNF